MVGSILRALQHVAWDKVIEQLPKMADAVRKLRRKPAPPRLAVGNRLASLEPIDAAILRIEALEHTIHQMESRFEQAANLVADVTETNVRLIQHVRIIQLGMYAALMAAGAAIVLAVVAMIR